MPFEKAHLNQLVKEVNLSEGYMQYTQTTLDHARNPRNVGSLDDANVVVQVGDPDCGDTLLLFMKITDGIVEDISYLIKGCGAAIATSSIGSEMAKGKSLNEVLLITDESISEALGGLPGEKEHCSNLIASAIHAAIGQYISTITGETPEIKCN